MEAVSYDGNGNILIYLRNGHRDGALAMDQLTFHYPGTNGVADNKLKQVTDVMGTNDYADDLKTQGPGNYEYNKIGNLTADKANGINASRWRVYGMIVRIEKSGDVVLDAIPFPAFEILNLF